MYPEYIDQIFDLLLIQIKDGNWYEISDGFPTKADLRIFIDHGYNLNRVFKIDNTDTTALNYACYILNIRGVNDLIELRANVTSPTGLSPIESALMGLNNRNNIQKCEDIIKLLIRNNAQIKINLTIYDNLIEIFNADISIYINDLLNYSQKTLSTEHGIRHGVIRTLRGFCKFTTWTNLSASFQNNI
jgi:hypothetical protein